MGKAKEIAKNPKSELEREVQTLPTLCPSAHIGSLHGVGVNVRLSVLASHGNCHVGKVRGEGRGGFLKLFNHLTSTSDESILNMVNISPAKHQHVIIAYGGP